MGRNKTVKEKRDEQREKLITIIYCRKVRMPEVIEVLRNHNNSKLWNTPLKDWSLAFWNEYLELKKIHDEHRK